ncbi:MAG: glycosyltransferase family 2 protein [Candidatus Limnocylindrales bacterium]
MSAIIVHYETPELLAQCLAALRASEGVAIEALVIDNASRDFGTDEIETWLPGARVIRNSRNSGFAVAANLGLCAGSGRYLLLLNPDTIVEPDTLATMVRYMDQRPQVGCATARLVMENGKLDLACRRSFPTPQRALYRLSLLSRVWPRSRRFGQYNLTYLDELAEAEIDAPCGAFMMVRAEVIEDIGLLDESYFMYGEDLDWAFRMKSAGWQVMYNPGATALHFKRASSTKARSRSIRAFYGAMRIFYSRHYEETYPKAVSWLIYRAIDGREAIELASARVRSPLHGAGA